MTHDRPPPGLPVTFATDNIWAIQGDNFHPDTQASQSALIPPGLYQFQTNPMGWWLHRLGDNFSFPFKVYGKDQSIVDRFVRAWDQLDGNLGILLNGLKGTGKSVTAQLIANAMVAKGVAVIVANHPIPLAQIMGHAIAQPLVVVFDEFEKTHDADHQQALLTALDGMSRGPCKRAFVFTTNERRVNENLLDRPSRVRYCWDFQRISDDVIEEIMNDLLRPDLQHLRPAIAAYLGTRLVLSIDVVKAVLTEVNTFGEGPEAFERIMNLSEQEVRSFSVTMPAPDGGDPLQLSTYFRPAGDGLKMLRTALTPSGRSAMIEKLQILAADGGRAPIFSDHQLKLHIQIKDSTDDPNIWLCHVALPVWKTWMGKELSSRIPDHHPHGFAWLDKRPENWEIPAWAASYQSGAKVRPGHKKAMFEFFSKNTVFGGSEYALVPLLFEPNFDLPVLKTGPVSSWTSPF